jgi:hypothetical protein
MRSGAFWARALALATVLTAVACSSEDDSSGGGGGASPHLFIAPANMTVEEGSTLQLSAFVVSASGSVFVPAAEVVWASSDTDVATVTAGLLEGISFGTTVVTATHGDLVTNVTATVLPGVVGIQILPPNADVALDMQVPYKLMALYSNHTARDVAADATWSVRDPRIAVASGNVVTGLAAGTTRLTASYRGRDASTDVTVSGRTVTSLAISGGPTALEQILTGQLVATATFDDASTLDVTDLAQWTSSDDAVVAVSGGILTPAGSGEATVTASFAQGARAPVSAEQVITVKAATNLVEAIAIAPATATIPLGTSAAYTATATFQDGATGDVTSLVEWTLENAAEDSGVHGVVSGGLVSTVSTPGTTITAGTTTVVATYTLADETKVTGEAALEVTTDALASITVAATPATISVGGTTTISATGSYGDPVSFTYDLGDDVTWFAIDGSPLNDTVIALDPTTGVAVGLSAGTATVEAWMGGEKKGEVVVTVA